MRIRKAVITAAGRAQRHLPMQALVDSDGVGKPILQIIVDEACSAGVEEVCVVVAPGDQRGYAEAAGPHASRVHFVVQPSPRGYGHALYCAADFTGDEPFLHLISDHLYIASGLRSCAQQLVELATAEDCAVSAVQATRETMLPYYGTVGARRLPQRQGVYEVETVIEKPTPTVAEQRLLVPGLRAGHYLCFFGMHVLTPAVMEMLKRQVMQQNESRPVQLSDALAQLPGQQRYLAAEVAGVRYNLGLKYGLMQAQLALAVQGPDRDDVLAQMLEVLAQRPWHDQATTGDRAAPGAQAAPGEKP